MVGVFLLVAIILCYGFDFSRGLISRPFLGKIHSLQVKSLRTTAHAAATTDLTAPGKISLTGVQVTTLDGAKVSLADEIEKNEKRTLLAVLTHFADYNCWEMVMNMKADYDAIVGNDTQIICIGIGNTVAAKQFVNDIEMDTSKMQLFCDETGAVSDAFGCYKGLLYVDKAHRERWPSTDISPILKLIIMCAGIGSPGTLLRVISGYIGDWNGDPADRKWVTDGLLQGTKKGRWPPMSDELLFENVPADSGLRPFELATLRLQVGLHILKNWGTLAPKDGDLVTRMGGAFVFEKGAADESNISFKHYDTGICAYTKRKDLLAALKR